MYSKILIIWLLGCMMMYSLLLSSCKQMAEDALVFTVLKSDQTGLNFSNNLHSSDSFNVFKYMYFYNGAGVGLGDFNNDGLVDVFFASNQEENSLFLNQGGLSFRNVTREANILSTKMWSTGVSVIDINNDGLLDIYISNVGNYRILHGQNQFLICQGIDKDGVPQYVDKAKELGLNFSGFGTQAAFIDYDLDGDLDLFLLNHSVHENGNFRPREVFSGTVNPKAGNRFYRNDGNSFTDVTAESGISSTTIGYGLGVVVSDINLDGYPDIYIGNDFHENDYLYINQKNGRFRDNSDSSLMHTSRYTMGVDIADANNDGFPEIFSVDMLPSDPYILKRSPGEDSYDVFNMKIKYGYNYQYSRNALQFNRGNGLFSEIALYAGVAATDWSWAPLWMDFDNDGLKDLFISNGIPKRLNDIDYINYISDQSIQQQIRDNKLDEKDKALIDKFPQIKIPNKFYKNLGNMKFDDLSDLIGDDIGSYSNGAAYADFDNDGDMDVIVNNIDDDALLYKNLTNDKKEKPFISITLKGPDKNINGIGSKVIVYTNDDVRVYEKYPVRGFLSSMEVPLHIGLNNAKTDSILLIWPDNTYEKLNIVTGPGKLRLTYKEGLPEFNYASIFNHKKTQAYPVKEIDKSVNLEYKHTENSFPEFNREPLIPHMLSTEGPAIAVGDVDKNGLDDVFFGAAKGGKRGLYLQEINGKFWSVAMPGMEADSNYEDVDAIWQDVNNDGNPDLIVASGGNEFFDNDRHQLPRVYLNNGNANLVWKRDAFEGINETQGCLVANDINGDGYIDLFIGGRGTPWNYGREPSSYLLLNDGTGKFSDVTGRYCKELKNAGFVTDAIWYDVNNDNTKDLVVCSEWGTIDAYLLKEGKLVKHVLSDKRGWWNFILPLDVNRDGKIDFVAGNLGLNSRLHASESEPVKLYYNDFDENGKKEQMLTYYLDGQEVPFYNKSEMEKQMPEMRKRFLFAKDFAVASPEDIMTRQKMKSADILTADYFASALLVNKGNMQFDIRPLAWQAQLAPLRDGIEVTANNDSLHDVLLVGNYYENNVEMGRYDADFGSLLINNGKGDYTYEGLRGVRLTGQSRKVRRIIIDKKEAFVIARNNDSAMLIRFTDSKAR